ncbi:MAG: B12-binding domain-containing radical SAM protein [Planctomycetes bacterium]|nr:B12-binding domain-containing radical SAM protein [Planctomycetota bacterium]
MKTLYINPRSSLNTIVLPEVMRDVTLGRRKAIFAPLNLCICAAVTPKNYDIEIVDECVRPVDFEAKADVVGITSMTCTARRAYWIADEFRKRGAKVVMGGIHPSALPDEAALHADSVCVGEAEATLPRFFRDLESNGLQKIYRADDAGNVPIATPRRDVISKEEYLVANPVQISRGCPHRCRFCTTYAIFGRRYRTRPIEDIVAEMKSTGGRFFIFADDNLIGDAPWAKEFFRALIPLGIQWAGQSTILMAKDDELLHLAKRSGCRGLILGLESTSQDALDEGSKRYAKAKDYLRAIRKFQSHAIGIWGSFLFGFDSDTPKTCAESVLFAERAKLVMSCYPILTPYPGTPLYAQFKSEGRLLTEDWSKYNGSTVVFEPKQMSAETLRQLQLAAFGRFFSPLSILRRLGFLPFKKYSWIANSASCLGLRAYFWRKGRRIPTLANVSRLPTK